MPAPSERAQARINGAALHAVHESLGAEELRQRAYSELLRQEAIARGLLGASDEPATQGALSQAASDAVEILLEQALQVEEPSEEECLRHHGANQARYSIAERVRMRHILFAVTPGVDVVALRGRAEAALLEVRCRDEGEGEGAFARAAAALSNCPSGADGGELGWLLADECAPEIARQVFGQAEVGVLSRLVHSRFGLHVIEVLEREPGRPQGFEAVRGAVAQSLRQQSYVTALRQYMKLLAGGARIEGVDIEAADSPLVQ